MKYHVYKDRLWYVFDTKWMYIGCYHSWEKAIARANREALDEQADL